jgi:nucleobase:cation symporter-1, NCS1 family
LLDVFTTAWYPGESSLGRYCNRGTGLFNSGSSFIYFAACWTTIWAAIVIVHWFSWREEGLQGYSHRWTVGATLFVSMLLLSILLFGSSALYVSPIAQWTGIDFSYVFGGSVAALIYALLCHYQQRKPRSIS